VRIPKHTELVTLGIVSENWPWLPLATSVTVIPPCDAAKHLRYENCLCTSSWRILCWRKKFTHSKPLH